MRKNKVDKRKVQGAETKGKLYGIAKRLFAEHSFSEVNIEDITDEAGITKGAFYVHFASKDALIAMLIAEYVSQADMDYKAFVESLPNDMPSASALLALAGRIADTLSNTLGYENMKKIYQLLLMGAMGTEAVREYGRELYTLVYGMLQKGVLRGELASPLSLDALSRHFVMAIRGVTFEWCVQHPDLDLREQTIEHIRLLVDGIRTQAHSQEEES